MTSDQRELKATRRIRSLDGLRGLAAAAVVLGHTRLVLLQNYPGPVWNLPGIRQAQELLGILGNHAVWLFFILSGLVLTRMMLGVKDFDYGNYVLGRLARLCLPVFGAVAFAFATMLIVSRDISGYGQWVDTHPNTYTPSSIIYDLTLVTGTSGNLSPLWSLQWEVLFSLLLILYVAVIRKVPPMLATVAAVGLCAAGQAVHSPILMFMSMFAIGTALAFAWDHLATVRDKIEIRMGRHMWLYAAGALLAATPTVALQLLRPLLSRLGLPATIVGMVDMTATMLGLIGCVGLVGLAKPLRAVFETRLMQRLGLISFSLYLVHEPVILGFVYLFKAAPVAVLLGMLLSFPIAQLFYWAIEKPSYRFSHRFSKSKTVEALTPATR